MAQIKSGKAPLIPYVKASDGGWQASEGQLAVKTPPAKALEHSSFQLLHDFDEHMESLDRDWLGNARVAAIVE